MKKPIYKRSFVRGGVLSLLIISAVLLVFWFYLGFINNEAGVGEGEYFSTNVLTFLFINLNIILLLISAFLVGRELVRLFFDRRRNILGSHLRFRLFVAFLAVTALPLIVVFFLASGLINNVVDGFFGKQVEASRDAALFLARSYYKKIKTDIEESIDVLKVRKFNSVEEFSTKVRKELDAFSVQVYDLNSKLLYKSSKKIATVSGFNEPEINKIEFSKAIVEKRRNIVYEVKSEAKFLRVYEPIIIAKEHRLACYTFRLDPDITHAFEIVKGSYEEFVRFKLFKNPIKSGYYLTFALITGLLLFAALWIAVQIAKSIVEPIQRLMVGTRSLATGNYEVEIDPGGDDEIGQLIDSFNSMAHEVIGTRIEVEKQKQFIEAVIENLAVGVILVDLQGRVSLVNKAAVNLLSIKNSIPADLNSILPENIVKPIAELLEHVNFETNSGVITAHFTYTNLDNLEVKLNCSATKITDIDNVWSSTVLLFDDITEISKVQSMEAWREVARRIAHEIKNPLTPLRLSAQRLIKRLENSEDRVVNSSVHTIVEHVDSITRLANEFSNFARMPRAEFSIASLSDLLQDIVCSYAENWHDTNFQLVLAPELPEFAFDPEQIRRALINLIDNALDSVKEKWNLRDTPRSYYPKIKVRTEFLKFSRVVKIVITDNGIGVRSDKSSKVFEPYYTTKSGGTGLGLAIVNSIVSEHKGNVKLVSLKSSSGKNRTNDDTVKVVVELPLREALNA